MKQHVARVMMLLAAGCGAAVQRVEASYSDCLSANEGLLDAPATRRIPLWPAQRIGSERGRGGTGPVGAHAIVVPDLGDRFVTLDTSRIASWGGSRPVHWDLRYDGGATQRAGAVRHAPFELFGMTPFADGYGALSPCDSNSCGIVWMVSASRRSRPRSPPPQKDPPRSVINPVRADRRCPAPAP
jgi:hypothetical protein